MGKSLRASQKNYNQTSICCQRGFLKKESMEDLGGMLSDLRLYDMLMKFLMGRRSDPCCGSTTRLHCVNAASAVSPQHSRE